MLHHRMYMRRAAPPCHCPFCYLRNLSFNRRAIVTLSWDISIIARNPLQADYVNLLRICNKPHETVAGFLILLKEAYSAESKHQAYLPKLNQIFK